MKFLMMLVPVALLLVFMRLGSGVLAAVSVNPMMLIGITGVFMILLIATRPKSKGPKPHHFRYLDPTQFICTKNYQYRIKNTP